MPSRSAAMIPLSILHRILTPSSTPRRLEHRNARSYGARKQAARGRGFTFMAWWRTHVIFSVKTSPTSTLERAGMRHTRLRNEAKDAFPERLPGFASTQTCAALDVYRRDCSHSQSRYHRDTCYKAPRPSPPPPRRRRQELARRTVRGFPWISQLSIPRGFVSASAKTERFHRHNHQVSRIENPRV